ncbi:Cellulose synthase-like protein G3 [Heracleum sosnowskyi]|uniref:Cellulose synthase-like protein G3 n=1 Tax=Heracleum sosnowskyi TaxID=360622 RepID=A0AAD8IAP0_9APIA|nr:Cellulose synthase-like protein G3 [Heracleum sosnowskyi]
MENPNLLLHKIIPMRRTWFNRIFAFIYTSAIFALFYNHFQNLSINSNTKSTTRISILMLLADLVLAVNSITYQAFRMCPIRREVFPQNIPQILKNESEYPALDIFICTADPYKEPPMGVINTALSVMAYDYPTEKLSVYVSDDGGSQLTLFAFMEAAKFARHWLPFCRKHNIVERCPEAYFATQIAQLIEGRDEIEMAYRNMKITVEKVVERGDVIGVDHIITDEEVLKTFSKCSGTNGFTSRNHPTIVQILLESCINRDVLGHALPNLIYLSREKSTSAAHHFKAGALNMLLRVSATMTNAPIILSLDCDSYSNDPTTPLRALCYYLDPKIKPELAYVQFPQIFHGINKNDIYGSEWKSYVQINAYGMDGLMGPNYIGTGCFFQRRAFFGDPLSILLPEIPELSPAYQVCKPIHDKEVLALADHVASCKYEDQTKWGYEIGFSYGSLVEDFYTGYQMHCKGWKSILCYPKRAAFLGSSPIALHDMLSQSKRWFLGYFEIIFCKYSPITYGLRSLDLLQALCYIHYVSWPIWSIPVPIYAFLPQLALINSLPIFPKVSDPWFYLYIFLFVGAFMQEFLDYMLTGGTIPKWWNYQKSWLIRGLTSFPFAMFEYILGCFGFSAPGFNVTSKVVDDEQTSWYEKGYFVFGVPSPMFLTITMAAIINLVAFSCGIERVISGKERFDNVFLQICLAGFVVIHSWPLYEAILLRTDKGKMPLKITLTSVALVLVLCIVFSLVF